MNELPIDRGDGAVEQRDYQIRVRGHLSDHWSEWLGGLTLAQLPDGSTTLTGRIVDRAALYGVLKKLEDMGLILISVNEVNEDAAEQSAKEEGSK